MALHRQVPTRRNKSPASPVRFVCEAVSFLLAIDRAASGRLRWAALLPSMISSPVCVCNAYVPSFPDQINDGPMVFSALNMVKGQINEFSSTQPTPQENRQDGSISFTVHAVHVRKLP